MDIKQNPNFPDETSRIKLNAVHYHNIHRLKNHPVWKGVPILKMPSDLVLYAEVIQQTKPDTIIEIGTKYGGSALFFQDMLGDGKVITVDIVDLVKDKDPRITYIKGDSTAEDTIKKVKENVKGSVMLVIDGDHHRRKVKWELHHYAPLVAPGQYLVLEDCYIDKGFYGPGEARDWFLERDMSFYNSKIDDKYLVGVNMGGWLRKR